MSHFTVLVVGEDVEEQLEPYQENNMGDCPREYLEFEVQVAKKDFVKECNKIVEEMKDKAIYEVWLQEKNYKRILTEYHGGEFYKGDLGYWSNPDARWDWYHIGGRWAGTFILKPTMTGYFGEKSWGFKEENPYERKDSFKRCDQARKKDIDFKAMQNDKKEIEILEKNWEEVISGKGFYKPEYFLKRYKTKKNYIKQESLFYTHAVLNEEWYESETMGWFGCSSETEDESNKWQLEFFDTFIKPLKPDTLLTIVDCHI